jgi:regulator of protease activity HflC (stomatin/prohibitin superfamily)
VDWLKDFCVCEQNEAEAAKTRTLLEAEADARAIELRAGAQAKAITHIAEALSHAGATEAARLQVAREYIAMYADIGQKSNTMIFNDRPADVNALMAQAASVFNSKAGHLKAEQIEFSSSSKT